MNIFYKLFIVSITSIALGIAIPNTINAADVVSPPKELFNQYAKSC